MEWKEVRLGDVCEIYGRIGFRGYTTNDLVDTSKEGAISLSPKNIINGELNLEQCTYIKWDKYYESPEIMINPNEIIITKTGSSVGRTTFVRRVVHPMTLNPQLVVLKNISENAEFLSYYIKSAFFQSVLKSIVVGSAIPTLSQKNLANLIINVPKEVDDQHRIASILSSLDRKIELNNKINADLEEMAQAIFKKWLSECTDEVTIGELSLNVTNYEKTNAEKVVLINSSDVTEGYFDHHNYSPNKNLKGHFKKRFQKGDILYSQVRPRNRHWAYCNFEANDYLASTQLMVIRNNPSLITSILLYQYIISDNVWKEFTLKTETRSGTFPQGNYEDLSQIRVPYNSDVEGISNQLETLYAKIFMLEKENSRLSTLRDTLLPRLMSGEIEVPD